MLNPLQKKETLTTKVASTLHLPHKQTSGEKFLIIVQKYGLYLAIFMAGYLIARLQSLLMLN